MVEIYPSLITLYSLHCWNHNRNVFCCFCCFDFIVLHVTFSCWQEKRCELLDHNYCHHQSEIGCHRVQQNLQKLSTSTSIITTSTSIIFTTTMISLYALLLTAGLILCQEVENPETSELFKPIPIFNIIKKPRVTFRKTFPTFNKTPTRYSGLSV